MLTFVSASVCLMSGLSISRGVFPVCLTCLRQSQWPGFCILRDFLLTVLFSRHFTDLSLREDDF